MKLVGNLLRVRFLIWLLEGDFLLGIMMGNTYWCGIGVIYD